jgi:[protein-PII] uridylyltransferase
VEWLVRHHLLMSDTAQKRDIGDPRTVRDFAKAVKSKKRLDLLTVLTVCDIRGVGPGTWNNWKAMLLRQLYRDTAEALENGLEALNRENRRTRPSARCARRWPTGRAPICAPRPRATTTPTGRGWPRRRMSSLPGCCAGSATEIRIDLHPDEGRDATRACFALADHPGIFSRLAGRWRWWGRISSMRAPIRPRTATRRRCSGCRTPRATPMRKPACPACAG